ncbi:HlyD family efflux transporter periplasmic adaptor subunit [Alkalinema sp. FACHB-956]|uniref:efflux RND transporter periplasmic adaptor subunit n=1 Tax=Alkalinema sp. FACHB-956 TaxID=2692768 RepID=UPI001685A796|nr:HlyD family efflux transporter periplasmic adaptor subunit [Alkalinema sp. FACHB-956]MBD2329853.1 efflux RND transporter periplasmic adaptor subunit [Alkalinema sp. FACHB-956]
MRIPSLTTLKKTPKVWWIAGAVVLVIAVPAIARLGPLQPRSKALDIEKLTTPVASEKLTLRVKASGTVTPRQTVNVSPKSAGRVMELLVEQGDYVQEGQVLARMDSSDLERERQQALANVEAARARLLQLQNPVRPEVVGQVQADVRKSQGEVLRSQGEIVRAEGQVADAQSQLEFATRQRQRQEMLQKEGAISENSLDEFIRKEQNSRELLRQAKAQFSQAKAQLIQAQAQVVGNQERLDQQDQTGSSGDIAIQEAQLAAAIAQLKAVENRIADTVVRAPFSGLVTQRYASVGAFVTPTTQASASGTGATSTSIVALASELEVIAKVPEVDISQVKPGQEAQIMVDAFPEEKFKGQVRLIAPEAIEERDVKFFQVRIKLVTGKDQLRSGMNADLEFIGKQLEALVVPTVAIVTKRGKTGVLVPDEKGKPKFQQVTIGATQDKRNADGKKEGQTQILDGINAGERVFVSLPEGQKLDQIVKDDQNK